MVANQHDGPTGALLRRSGVGRMTNVAERASLDVSPYGSPPSAPQPAAAGSPARASGTHLAHDRPDEERLQQAFMRAFGDQHDATQVHGPAIRSNTFAWEAPGSALAPPPANGVSGNSDANTSSAGAGARWPQLGLQNDSDNGALVHSAPNADSSNPTDANPRPAFSRSRDGGRALMGAFSFLSRLGVDRSSSPSEQYSGLGQGYSRPSQDGSPQQGRRAAQGLAWGGLGGGSGGGLQKPQSPRSSGGKPQSPAPCVSFYNHAFEPGQMDGRRQGGAVPSIADADRPQLKRRITASMSAIPADDVERGRAADGVLSAAGGLPGKRAPRQVHASEDGGTGAKTSQRGAGSLASRFASLRDLGPSLARVAVKRAAPGLATPVQKLDQAVAARLDGVLYPSSGQGAAAAGSGVPGQQRRDVTGAWREAPAAEVQPAVSLLEQRSGAAAAIPLLRSMSPLLSAAQSVNGQSPVASRSVGQVRGTSGGPLPSWPSHGAAAAVAPPNRLPLRSPLRPATSTAVRVAPATEDVPSGPLARSTSRQALRRAVTYATASGGVEAARSGQELQGPRVSGPVNAATPGAPASAGAGGAQSTLLSVRRRTATVLAGRRATYNGTGSMLQPRQAAWADDQGLKLPGSSRGGGLARVAVVEEEEAGARAAASMAWGP